MSDISSPGSAPTKPLTPIIEAVCDYLATGNRRGILSLGFETWLEVAPALREEWQRLESRCSALSLDAERLDWLNERPSDFDRAKPVWTVGTPNANCLVDLRGANIREAIDEARGAQQGVKP